MIVRGEDVLDVFGGLVEGLVEVAVARDWVAGLGVHEADVEEGVGFGADGAPEVFHPGLVGAGFWEVGG